MRLATTAAIVALVGAWAVAALGHAALIPVASRSALGSNLTVPWTAFGPPGSTLSVFQQATVGPEQVGINSSSGLLYVRQQGAGFNGDFSPGAVLLTQPNPDDGIAIRFQSPVFGFGTDIDPVGYTGPFTAYLQAFNASGTLLGIVSVSGTASVSGAGTAPFIGATSFADPISYLNLGLVEPGNSAVSQITFLNGVPVLGNVAIDQASAIAPVPEPSSILLVLAGGAMLAQSRRRRG